MQRPWPFPLPNQGECWLPLQDRCSPRLGPPRLTPLQPSPSVSVMHYERSSHTSRESQQNPSTSRICVLSSALKRFGTCRWNHPLVPPSNSSEEQHAVLPQPGRGRDLSVLCRMQGSHQLRASAESCGSPKPSLPYPRAGSLFGGEGLPILGPRTSAFGEVFHPLLLHAAAGCGAVSQTVGRAGEVPGGSAEELRASDARNPPLTGEP